MYKVAFAFVLGLVLAGAPGMVWAEESSSGAQGTSDTGAVRPFPGGRDGVIVACPAVYMPVCGVNGKTYGNSCEAKAASVAIARQGECGNDDIGPRKDGEGPRATLASTSMGFRQHERPRMASTSGDGKETMRDRMGSTSERMKEMKGKAEDKMKESVKRAASLMMANIMRLEKMIERIKSGADKLDQQGIDTTSARTDLKSATAELELAKADLKGIEQTAMLLLNADSMAAAGQSLNDVKTAFSSARTHLKNAESFIRSAVKKLKEAGPQRKEGERKSEGTQGGSTNTNTNTNTTNGSTN